MTKVKNKLTDDMKDQKLREIQDEIGNLELQRIDADSEVANKGQTIDSAVMFLTNADQFWNYCFESISSVNRKSRF